MAFGEVGTALSKIKSPAINLADTFAFSGIVTGFTKTPLTLLSTFTSDGSDANATFDSSIITDAYDEYLFIFNSIHPQTDGVFLTCQFNAVGAADFNETITSTFFQSYHKENDSSTELGYSASDDQAQGTAFNRLTATIGSDADQCASGTMRLYNPSSTTFVKHFQSEICITQNGDSIMDLFVAGYVNTTAAIDEIQFKMSSGEIQAGTIQVFGVI
jgi:hypothetical protein